MKWYFEKLGERHGPVSIQELVEILNRGEISRDNLVWRDGMANWTPLRDANALTMEDGAEMAICAQSGKVMPKSEMIPYGDKFISPEHSDNFVQGLMESSETAGVDDDGIIPGDFNVNIGSCLARGWDTLTQSFWPIIGVSALIFVILMASSQIPAGSFIVMVPIQAGLYYYLLRKVRGQSAEFSDAFYGFSNGFTKFMLMNLVQIGIAFALIIPGIIAMAIFVATEDPTLVVIGIVVIALVYLTYIYLTFAWMMAPIICFDKNLPFWDSMKISMKVFNKHFFWFMLFALTMSLIGLGGLLLLGIGIFVAIPWTYLAMIHLYEDIFGGRRATAQQQLEG